jgi:alpha-tubulin suppressor-like RCC1 family protein
VFFRSCDDQFFVEMRNGDIMGWGINKNYKVCLNNDMESLETPVLVEELRGARDIICGGDNMCSFAILGKQQDFIVKRIVAFNDCNLLCFE